MTTSADRSPRPSPRWGRQRFAGTVGDELAGLRGKNLGGCAECGRPVFVEHDFTRFDGRVTHVRCALSALTPSPMRLVAEGAVARHVATGDR